MKTTDLDVAIIGAGTAGLSARAEVAKLTDRYRVFDPGPYGTTCARSACMPSKAFLQSAHDIHRRAAFDDLGIVGADGLRIDGARVLSQTRKLRDGLVEGVIEGMSPWRRTHLVPHAPVFQGDGTLHAGGARFAPRATVIATGSRPVVPKGWRETFGARVLTSDEIFELRTLPGRVAVIGLGPVGLELGQALARLGVEVTGFDPSATIGGLEDPRLQSRLRQAIAAEMTVIEAQANPVEGHDGAIGVQWDDGRIEVDCLLVAMGRTPNLSDLGLNQIGVDLDDRGHTRTAAGAGQPSRNAALFRRRCRARPRTSSRSGRRRSSCGIFRRPRHGCGDPAAHASADRVLRATDRRRRRTVARPARSGGRCGRRRGSVRSGRADTAATGRRWRGAHLCAKDNGTPAWGRHTGPRG